MHDRAGQGASAFRAFLRGLPDDIAKAREDCLPVVLERDRPLELHAQRLMDTLGVEVRIVTQTVGARSMGNYIVDGDRQPFVENLIDFRHSLVQAAKRADANDATLEICPHCMCEVDVDPQPHRPGCAGIGKPRATSAPVLAVLATPAHSPAPRPPVRAGAAFNDGLDALERMDAGLPQQPEVDEQDPDLVLEEREPPAREEAAVPASPPAADQGVGSTPAAVVDESRGPAATELASRSSSTRRRRTNYWTPEKIIAAIIVWAEAHGRPPTSVEWGKGGDDHPSTKPVKDEFGSWAAGIEAAGFERPTRGRRSRPAQPTVPIDEPAVEPPPAAADPPGEVEAIPPREHRDIAIVTAAIETAGDERLVWIERIESEARRARTRAAALEQIAQGLRILNELHEGATA